MPWFRFWLAEVTLGIESPECNLYKILTLLLVLRVNLLAKGSPKQTKTVVIFDTHITPKKHYFLINISIYKSMFNVLILKLIEKILVKNMSFHYTLEDYSNFDVYKAL